MKKLLSFKWAFIIWGLNALSTLYFAWTLPGDVRVPMHWNAVGEIDGWASKAGGLGFSFGISTLLLLLMMLLPYYSPWYKRYRQRMEKVVPGLTAILLLFFSILGFYSLWIARSGNTESSISIILVLTGGLFILLGNIMPKVPKNFFIGFRTPWTLSSEEIWQKTHRIGGFAFVLGGLFMILKGLIWVDNAQYQQISMIGVLVILLYPALYSFLLYLRLNKPGVKSQNDR